MMKVTKNQPVKENRDLVAVLHKGGLYLPNAASGSSDHKNGRPLSCRVDSHGKISRPWYNPLQEILEANPKDATPIYEGDSITIQF